MGSNNFKNSMIGYMDRDQENLNFCKRGIYMLKGIVGRQNQ